MKKELKVISIEELKWLIENKPETTLFVEYAGETHLFLELNDSLLLMPRYKIFSVYSDDHQIAVDAMTSKKQPLPIETKLTAYVGEDLITLDFYKNPNQGEVIKLERHVEGVATPISKYFVNTKQLSGYLTDLIEEQNYNLAIKGSTLTPHQIEFSYSYNNGEDASFLFTRSVQLHPVTKAHTNNFTLGLVILYPDISRITDNDAIEVSNINLVSFSNLHKKILDVIYVFA